MVAEQCWRRRGGSRKYYMCVLAQIEVCTCVSSDVAKLLVHKSNKFHFEFTFPRITYRAPKLEWVIRYDVYTITVAEVYEFPVHGRCFSGCVK